MAFSIDMRFIGDERPTVDPLAIQWSAEGAFVWLVREGEAARVPVRIVQRRDGAVLVAGDLEPGETVVLEGVQNLRPGSAVAPRDSEPQAHAPGGPERGGTGGRPAGDEDASQGDGADNGDNGDDTPVSGAEARARAGGSEG